MLPTFICDTYVIQNVIHSHVHIKLSSYEILHFSMNIVNRFPYFYIITAQLDFNNCINLNMLRFVNNTLECIVDVRSQCLG